MLLQCEAWSTVSFYGKLFKACHVPEFCFFFFLSYSQTWSVVLQTIICLVLTFCFCLTVRLGQWHNRLSLPGVDFYFCLIVRCGQWCYRWSSAWCWCFVFILQSDMVGGVTDVCLMLMIFIQIFGSKIQIWILWSSFPHEINRKICATVLPVKFQAINW